MPDYSIKNYVSNPLFYPLQPPKKWGLNYSPLRDFPGNMKKQVRF